MERTLVGVNPTALHKENGSGWDHNRVIFEKSQERLVMLDDLHRLQEKFRLDQPKQDPLGDEFGPILVEQKYSGDKSLFLVRWDLVGRLNNHLSLKQRQGASPWSSRAFGVEVDGLTNRIVGSDDKNKWFTVAGEGSVEDRIKKARALAVHVPDERFGVGPRAKIGYITDRSSFILLSP